MLPFWLRRTDLMLLGEDFILLPRADQVLPGYVHILRRGWWVLADDSILLRLGAFFATIPFCYPARTRCFLVKCTYCGVASGFLTILPLCLDLRCTSLLFIYAIPL